MYDAPEDEVGALGDVAGLRALELGCGACQFGIKVAMRGAAVTGLDFSIAQLRHAFEHFEETGIRFPIVQANGERLPFRDEAFDLVFCDHGVMGFADPSRTVPEVARVLRPGGRFVFNGTTPWIWVAWGDEGDPPASREMRRDYFDMGSMDVRRSLVADDRVPADLRRLDPSVPRERAHGRGPDRAPAERRRHHDL